MSWVSRLTGQDARRNRVNADRGQIDDQIGYEQNGTGFLDAFNQSAGSFLQNAMPQFRQQMQLTREDGIRRGISTGDLGTSNEGDLASAFQRNTANALGGMAFQGYEGSRNRILDLISGKTGMDMNDANNSSNFWASILGSGMQLAGMAFAGGKGK